MRPTGMGVADWNQAGKHIRDKIESEQVWHYAGPGRSIEWLARRVGISEIRMDYLLRRDPEWLWGICARCGIDPVPLAQRLGVELVNPEELV